MNGGGIARLSARSLVAAGGQIDGRLLLGSTLFGAGWGLSGPCPGPAVVAFVIDHHGTGTEGAARLRRRQDRPRSKESLR